jgi:hypothetical protein
MFFFILRHPVSRFVSGFNSRLRQGRPCYDYPWSPGEREMFAEFRTCNELAEALSDDNLEHQQKAQRAMQVIAHVRDSYEKWFHSLAYFKSRLPDLLFVGFQERLDEDFKRLVALLGIDEDVQLPTDLVVAHRTPASFDTSLSEFGRENILAHYARDVWFYKKALAKFGYN